MYMPSNFSRLIAPILQTILRRKSNHGKGRRSELAINPSEPTCLAESLDVVY